MARQGEQSPNRGNIAERGLRFLRDFHLGLGAVALVGAAVFPPAAVVAGPFAVYEGVNAGVHELLRQAVRSRRRPDNQSAAAR